MSNKYIIIAGTNKAATTSVFEYLAAHPQVCPAFIKQTFFFLNKEWQQQLQLHSLYDYNKGEEQYDLFFRDCKAGQVKLEASPEYLYAPATAEKIFSFSKKHDCEIIFMLRDPVTRFISLFHFGKQQGVIAEDCNFHTFLTQSTAHTANTNTSLMAYETGFYSKYLQQYVSIFGREKLKIYFFEEVMADTSSCMKKISTDLNIDATFYENFTFETHNKTITVKNRLLSNMYKKARQVLIQSSFKNKAAYNTAMIFRKTITPVYRKINLKELKKEEISEMDIAFLKDAYKNEKEKLVSLLGMDIPW